MNAYESSELYEFDVYRDPETVFTAATAGAELEIALDPPFFPYDSEDKLHQRMRQEAVDRAIGIHLSDFAAQAETPQQFAAAANAMASWLPGCSLTQPLRSAAFPLPTTEMRQGFFGKVVRDGWVHDYDKLIPAVESLAPLLQRRAQRNPADYFADLTRRYLEFELRNLNDINSAPSSMLDKIVFLSALTDRGALDESIWGKVGIMAYGPRTPFAVTEEVYRRFVLEQRDSYAPKTERAHRDTLRKYCYNVLQVACSNGMRNRANTQKIAATLGLNGNTELNMPLKPLIQLANQIAVVVNRQGGAVQPDGTLHAYELLAPDSRASVGEALNRVLQLTRSHESPQLHDLQEYQDNVHVEIVNELSLLGTDLKRAVGEIALENE